MKQKGAVDNTCDYVMRTLLLHISKLGIHENNKLVDNFAAIRNTTFISYHGVH